MNLKEKITLILQCCSFQGRYDVATEQISRLIEDETKELYTREDVDLELRIQRELCAEVYHEEHPGFIDGDVYNKIINTPSPLKDE